MQIELKLGMKEGGVGGRPPRQVMQIACFPTACVGFPQFPPTAQKHALCAALQLFKV